MKFKIVKYYSTLSLWIMCFFSFAQNENHRNSGFSKPLNLPFNLAGSFGEPRLDHFHSGIDIKTNGVEGELVFAVYDGFISRIRVSPFGYGKAIYITHTNGFTSVYGHLSKFNDVLEKYVHNQHYLIKKSELDLSFDATVFPVKQNDTIAFSGNTGGSSAPHLHFEIRNTKTQHALNALDFYPKDFYLDTIPPQINKVKVTISEDNFLHSLSEEYEILKKNEFYTTENPIPIYNNSTFHFSLEGFDKQDFSENKNGINKIEVYKKDSLVFKYDLNEINFHKTRMCNAFVDYNEMLSNNGYFYNCYKLPGNSLEIYFLSDGFFKIIKNDTLIFNIICSDYLNNANKISLLFFQKNFDIDTASVSNGSDAKYHTNRISDSSILKNKDFSINFPKASFYSDNISCLTTYNSNKTEILSTVNEIFAVDNPYFPLQKSAKIEIKSAIKKNRNKIIIVHQDNKEKETALKTFFDKNKFCGETKELGTFYLKYDTTKPIVEISNLTSQITNLTIQVKILDELSGIDTYNGFIDNKWINFYYDAKNNLIQYNLDEYCTKGEHILKIIVTDKVGNKTIVQQKFQY